MSSARRPRTTYKVKTMLNLLHVYTSSHHGSSVLRYWQVTHVTHSHLSTHLTHDPWPADPLSALSPIKLRRFWLNLVHCFWNKFADKCFPPQLNNVSTLPCETWHVHCTHATVELLQKLQNLSHLNCVLQLCQIWIQLITACGKYSRRRCTKQASLI